MILTFGKYKDEDICDVPLDYLIWLEEHVKLSKTQREEINFEINRRENDTSSQGKIVKSQINIIKK